MQEEIAVILSADLPGQLTNFTGNFFLIIKLPKCLYNCPKRNECGPVVCGAPQKNVES